MQVVCLGLLLFSLTWAAPTFQPQTEKTKQDCVEEQKITYKGHHEKHGDYILKYVYTSPGRKNQTDMKEENNKDDTAFHHLGKRRKQEPPPKKNIAQEREKALSLHKASDNNQTRKSQNLFVNRQIWHEDHSSKENIHNDLKMSIYPEPSGHNWAENEDDAINELHDQEEYGVALMRHNRQHLMGPVTVNELLRGKGKQEKPRNVLSKILRGANYAEVSQKDKKNHQRDDQAQNIPVKSKSTHHIKHNSDYLKPHPKVNIIPSDFEGSGNTDLQERGDNGISPFSGDGQPFGDIPSKGKATGPNLESINIQTGFSDTSESETTNPDTRGPGFNDIPEKEENSENAIGTRDATERDENASDVRIMEGSNDIIGSTNFKELPGKQGNRVDSESQNAHQGKVEFHYPIAPTEKKRKEHSNRNQATVSDKQRYSGNGKSQQMFISSPGLDNEIGSHNGPTSEENIVAHNNNRKNHYIGHRPNNTIRKEGMSQRQGSWDYRRPHSSRSPGPPRKGESSESSESNSSSDSDGD
ncbi:PREDICTED: matrix extracellular phosphoglycoprotein [Chrysochloris asiatica]|uniref:Matrix extracellular phosphoglycoprotein n=1 Tax=Chrysochloris asiatica TaxID=185453 RepID=A0A9B0WUK6_CHRAS|nr:PREDICTED: matrix extracellular phosphoglycoprotein [Chrysochloris asiatica]